nr:cytochrome c heme attachment protein [Streptosarcina sp. YL-2023a]
MLLTNVALLVLLVLRWIKFGHFPLSNLYESLLFLSWSLSFFHIILEKWIQNNFIGAVTSPIVVFTNAFATFSLPPEMQSGRSLVPALQSNWLMMHVTLMMLSYAALISGSLLAITFLVVTYNQEKKLLSNPPIMDYSTNTLENNQPALGFHLSKVDSNLNAKILVENGLNENANSTNSSKFFFNLNEYTPLSKSLDNLSYRILGIGFPLLTIGILSGAVWANEAWGSYWSWDPKETWAFITWLVFAIYLHIRITKGWEGKIPAIIASFGFFVVWVCYLGVNILGKGLHAYQ